MNYTQPLEVDLEVDLLGRPLFFALKSKSTRSRLKVDLWLTTSSFSSRPDYSEVDPRVDLRPTFRPTQELPPLAELLEKVIRMPFESPLHRYKFSDDRFRALERRCREGRREEREGCLMVLCSTCREVLLEEWEPALY